MGELVPVGVRLPREMKAELHERAEAEGSTLGEQVRSAVSSGWHRRPGCGRS